MEHNQIKFSNTGNANGRVGDARYEFYIAISHAGQDSELSEPIVTMLQEQFTAGEVFYDKTHDFLLGGGDTRPKLRKIFLKAKIVIVFMSNEYNDNNVAQFESKIIWKRFKNHPNKHGVIWVTSDDKQIKELEKQGVFNHPIDMLGRDDDEVLKAINSRIEDFSETQYAQEGGFVSGSHDLNPVPETGKKVPPTPQEIVVDAIKEKHPESYELISFSENYNDTDFFDKILECLNIRNDGIDLVVPIINAKYMLESDNKTQGDYEIAIRKLDGAIEHFAEDKDGAYAKLLRLCYEIKENIYRKLGNHVMADVIHQFLGH